MGNQEWVIGNGYSLLHKDLKKSINFTYHPRYGRAKKFCFYPHSAPSTGLWRFFRNLSGIQSNFLYFAYPKGATHSQFPAGALPFSAAIPASNQRHPITPYPLQGAGEFPIKKKIRAPHLTRERNVGFYSPLERRFSNQNPR